MVHSIPNITIPTIGYTMAHHGRMAFPVDSSSLIYSHFEHVSGIPAPEGTQGVTITKLNLLDVLIGQLDRIGKGKAVLSPAQAVPAGRMDALIESYRNLLAEAKEASALMPYLPSPSAQPGALFSLTI